MDLATLAHECAPSVAVETVLAVVSHESRSNPFAIGVNGGARLTRQPANKEEAIEIAKVLMGMGISIDLGLGQINSSNLARVGLTVEQAFEPCANLRAAEKVLRGCYDPAARRLGAGQEALQQALSCYNTGHSTRGFANGYVARVYAQAKTTKR